jgi:hypothetical protein
MRCSAVCCRTNWFVSGLILSGALLLLFQLPVRAGQSVTLAWNPSSTPNVAGYKIYYGTACRGYTNAVAVGNTTNATISGLSPGITYYFAATTLDSAGAESGFSNEATYPVPRIVPTITTPPTASAINYGQTLANSSLSWGTASTAGGFAFATPAMAPNAGTASVPVTFTPTDTNGYASAAFTVVVTVNPALATVTLGNLDQMYDGTARPVSVTTSPAGLAATVTYNGSPTAPAHAGSYAVEVTVNDPNYAGNTTGTLVVKKAAAALSLTNLAQTYDGAAKFVAADTMPTNLVVAFTYNGSIKAPTNSGSYTVVGTVMDVNYQGIVTNTLLINPAATPAGVGKSVTLAWNPSSSPNVAGYKMYYGTACHCYTSSVAVGNTTNATISGLSPGTTYYFAATTLDSAGAESGFSNEATYAVPVTAAALTAAVRSGGQFSFMVSGDGGQHYVVQASTNLLDWVSLQTNAAPFLFTDTNTAGFNQRFYRAFYLSP